MQKQRRAPPPTTSNAVAVDEEAVAQAATTDPAAQAYMLQSSMGNQYLAEMAKAQSQDAAQGGRDVFAPGLEGGEQDPLDRARPVTGLPGATAGDHSDFGVAQYEKIEDRSTGNTAAYNNYFQHMDANRELGFTMDPAVAGTSGRAPVHMGYEGEDQRTNEAEHLAAANGIDTLHEYRQMLLRDFNFNALINKYTHARPGSKPPEELRASGESAFLADVVKRFYPDNAVGDAEVEVCVAIAQNIWSYATCGYDMSGTTDIAEMQGLLYVFSKEIRQSSDTNTKMAGDWFVVPGTEDWDTPIKLKGGDGRHGRATVLTTRHLIAGMSVPPPERDLTGFDASFLLLDRSGSMQTDEYSHIAGLLEVGGIDGDISLAGYDDGPHTLKKVQNGDPLTQDEAGAILNTASEEAAAVNNKEIPDFDKAEPALTDRSRATQEEGLASALAWVKSPDIGREGRQQLLVVTDEPDFNPGALAELQKEARAKNLSVKVLYSFNSQAPVGTYGGKADSYVIVDVMAIEKLLNHWQVARQGTQQLDWARVAKTQNAEVHRW